VTDPLLILNGDTTSEDKPINNLVFLTNINPSYSTTNTTSLLSVTVVGNPIVDDDMLERRVRGQLGEWYGVANVSTWNLLRIYRIPYAQPPQVSKG